jgi:hypothetical protein
MKKLYSVIIGAVATIGSMIALTLIMPIITTGCKTTAVVTNNTTNTVVTFDLQTATNLINGVASLGVYTATQPGTGNPALVPYFRLAAATIGGLTDANTFDPNTIETALTKLSISGLNTEYGVLAIKAALLIYQTAFASVVSQQLDQVTYLKPILMSLTEGIQLGLSSTTSSAKLLKLQAKPVPAPRR